MCGCQVRHGAGGLVRIVVHAVRDREGSAMIPTAAPLPSSPLEGRQSLE